MKTMIYNHSGYKFEITYRPELSNSDYTTHKVFTIKTDCESYPLASKIVEEIMNDGSWRHGYYTLKNKQEPSMQNALHTYHTFSYDEDKDEFTYTLVTPYDD